MAAGRASYHVPASERTPKASRSYEPGRDIGLCLRAHEKSDDADGRAHARDDEADRRDRRHRLCTIEIAFQGTRAALVLALLGEVALLREREDTAHASGDEARCPDTKAD